MRSSVCPPFGDVAAPLTLRPEARGSDLIQVQPGMTGQGSTSSAVGRDPRRRGDGFQDAEHPESGASLRSRHPEAPHIPITGGARFVGCCGCTAMLVDAPSEPRVSTGLEALDDVLGGLYWGDNVVWQLDRAPVEPFYRAIASPERGLRHQDRRLARRRRQHLRRPRAGDRRRRPGSELAQPAELLREIHRLCHPRRRRLLLFESLDSMVRAWGAAGTREFFARCCPLLLEVGAIAYWTMSARDTPPARAGRPSRR